MTNRTQDWLMWGLGRLGWAGVSGLILLLAAFLVCAMLVRPMVAKTIALQTRVATLAAQPAPVLAAVTVRDWRADLPSGDQAYVRLTKLFQAAEEAGLNLSEGSYRRVGNEKSGVQRLIVELPVSGRYATLRGFLASALNNDSALALESVDLQRGSMGETELEADLRFVLFVGEVR